MTAREIADALLAAKGITGAPKADQRSLIGSVQACLRTNEGKRVNVAAEGARAVEIDVSR
jgi:hypothetical protein